MYVNIFISIYFIHDTVLFILFNELLIIYWFNSLHEEHTFLFSHQFFSHIKK